MAEAQRDRARERAGALCAREGRKGARAGGAPREEDAAAAARVAQRAGERRVAEPSHALPLHEQRAGAPPGEHTAPRR